MKNKLILASIVLAFMTSGCKKELVCECTQTSSSTYIDSQGNTTTNNSDPTKTETTYKKVKKSKMKTTCGDSEYSSSSTSSFGGQTSTNSYVAKNKCIIK